MVLVFNFMDHWQARLRGPRLMARGPAWRLNAHRSLSMTDVKIHVSNEKCRPIGGTFSSN